MLENFCNNYDNKDILAIANEFSVISELILEQKHLFDEEFHKKVTQAEKHCKEILDILFAFEKIFSYFIDFSIKQDKNNKLDEDNKVREQINKHKIELSTTALCISHIINNAYFSNTPNNEIQRLSNLLKQYENSVSYQEYKKIIEQYKSCPTEEIFSDTIDIFIPFHKDIFLEFFSKDEFEELCKFILYLIDLETGGVFLYYTYAFLRLSKQMSHISKKDLQTIVSKDFYEKFQNIKEDKIIEYLTDHIQNKIAAYLAELSIKSIRDKLKAEVQNHNYNSSKMCEVIASNIITKDNINRLGGLLNVIGQHNRDTKQQADMVARSFQQIQNIQEMQSYSSLDYVKNALKHSLKSNTTQTLNIIFTFSKDFIKKTFSPFAVFEIYNFVLDQIFPTISKEDLMRQITLFMLGMRGKKDSEYAKWEKGKPYFYIPKDLNKSLIIGDFMHSLLLDVSLDMGYCIHNPSLGAYAKNSELAQASFKDVIKKNLYAYDSSYFMNAQENETTQIYREAYIKVHSYIDNMQAKKTNTSKEALSNFENLINKKLTQTKLKYQNPQNGKQYQKVGERSNTQRDFLIQLKRVAEYSYRVYNGERVIETENKVSNENVNQSTKESILSHFIYNPSFIPTKIDIREF